MPRDLARKHIEKLSGCSFGAKLSDQFSATFSDGRVTQQIVFNDELTGHPDRAIAVRRPFICALLTRVHPRTRAVAVRQILLTAPKGRAFTLQGFRLDGTLLLDGGGEVRDDGTTFAMVSVESPGQCRYRIGGVLTDDGLKWRQHERSPERTPKQDTAPGQPG